MHVCNDILIGLFVISGIQIPKGWVVGFIDHFGLMIKR
jgi:hypothetical protein